MNFFIWIIILFWIYKFIIKEKFEKLKADYDKTAPEGERSWKGLWEYFKSITINKKW